MPVDQAGRIPSGAVGSAIVSCAGDASAVAVHVHAQGASAYTGLRSPGWGDANWESTGTHQRLAGVSRGAGGVTSKIKVVNTGHTTARLDLTYYSLNGAAYTLPSADIASFSALSIEPPAGIIPEGFQGALDAHAAKQALAVFVDNVDVAGRVVASASGSRGATTLHLPALAKYVNEYGHTYNTCVNFANLESVANTVQVVYYWHNAGGGSGWRETFSIPANGQTTRCQQNQPLPHTWLSARVTAQYPIAATVHGVNEIAGWSAGYSGASTASTSVVLPFVTRQGTLGGRQWDTVITLQNAGARTTTPHLVFYASDEGASCAVSTTHLAHVYGVSGVVMSPVTAGRYYLRVVTVDRYDAQTPYRFRLSVNSANWQPDFTTSSMPYQPDTHLDDVYPGEQKVFRWYGIGSRQGGVSEIAIKVYGEPNGEQCPSGWPESVVPAGYTVAYKSVNSVMESGAFTFTFPMPGIYVIDLRVRRVGQPEWLDSKPVRVGCRFAPWVTPIPPLAHSWDGRPNTVGFVPGATMPTPAPAPTQTPVP